MNSAGDSILFLSDSLQGFFFLNCAVQKVLIFLFLINVWESFGFISTGF